MANILGNARNVTCDRDGVRPSPEFLHRGDAEHRRAGSAVCNSGTHIANGRQPAQPAGAPPSPRHAQCSRAFTSLPRRRSRVVEASSTVTGNFLPRQSRLRSGRTSRRTNLNMPGRHAPISAGAAVLSPSYSDADSGWSRVRRATTRGWRSVPSRDGEPSRADST